MTTPPSRPSIFHIAHVRNLASIVADGGLRSDAAMMQAGGPSASIGMSAIKQRRLSLDVTCHPGDTVGEYVPFYFCARSIMLFVIHRQNHPDLTYRDGQGPIVHLEADLNEVVAWAAGIGRRWAFTSSNAGARYTDFRSDLANLDEIDWTAVAATDFRKAAIKEPKQAEFLVRDEFPWSLVRRIGVFSQAVKTTVETAIASAGHRPPVEIIPGWYY
jgi:ssDNA thymidine ADP-ribosyltransferase, DarT